MRRIIVLAILVLASSLAAATDLQVVIPIDEQTAMGDVPWYSGPTGCSSAEKEQCRLGCVDLGPPGRIRGNWFLTVTCERTDHPSDPDNPIVYALDCRCNWASWADIAGFPWRVPRGANREWTPERREPN